MAQVTNPIGAGEYDYDLLVDIIAFDGVADVNLADYVAPIRQALTANGNCGDVYFDSRDAHEVLSYDEKPYERIRLYGNLGGDNARLAALFDELLDADCYVFAPVFMVPCNISCGDKAWQYDRALNSIWATYASMGIRCPEDYVYCGTCKSYHLKSNTKIVGPVALELSRVCCHCAEKTEGGFNMTDYKTLRSLAGELEEAFELVDTTAYRVYRELGAASSEEALEAFAEVGGDKAEALREFDKKIFEALNAIGSAQDALAWLSACYEDELYEG